MNYGIAVLSVIAMRKETSEQSEMVSQLLFGELYSVLAEEEKWIKILTCFDQYEGWISRKQHVTLTEAEYSQSILLPRPVLTARYAEAMITASDAVMIAAGSDLLGYNKEKRSIQIQGKYMQISGYDGETILNDFEHVVRTARQFLHTPYLWGGRSLFGCDCSGFVQTVFKIHNVNLPRDASQQADLGMKVDSLQDSEPCDLVFFADDRQRIHHVGMIIAPGEIIHCSGSVRIDTIDHIGIYNTQDGCYSHTSFIIRRYNFR